jgi:hypothetical protein
VRQFRLVKKCDGSAKWIISHVEENSCQNRGDPTPPV